MDDGASACGQMIITTIRVVCYDYHPSAPIIRVVCHDHHPSAPIIRVVCHNHHPSVSVAIFCRPFMLSCSWMELSTVGRNILFWNERYQGAHLLSPTPHDAIFVNPEVHVLSSACEQRLENGKMVCSVFSASFTPPTSAPSHSSASARPSAMGAGAPR